MKLINIEKIITEKYLHRLTIDIDISDYIESNRWFGIEKDLELNYIEWLLIDCKTTKPFTLINNRILIRGLWGNSHIHSVLFFNESGDVIGGIAKRGYDIPSVAKFRIVGLITKRLWN